MYRHANRSPDSPTSFNSEDQTVHIEDDDEFDENDRLIANENEQNNEESQDTALTIDPLASNISNSSANSRRQMALLLRTLTHLLVIEMIYCYYLDNNIALLVLRGLQLVILMILANIVVCIFKRLCCRLQKSHCTDSNHIKSTSTYHPFNLHKKRFFPAELYN